MIRSGQTRRSPFSKALKKISISTIPADISALFASGEQGVLYDPSDFSSMFQDSAGTIPVTATGQSVGRILDRSGRGNHWLQATAAARPVLRQDGAGKYYLEFDGVDDLMACTNLFTSSMEVFVAILRVGTGMGILFSGTSGDRFMGVFQAGDGNARESNAGSPSYYVDGVLSSPANRDGLNTSFTAGVQHVMEIRNADLSAIQWRNGFDNNFTGAFAYANRVYGLLARDVLTAPQRTTVRQYLATKNGAIVV